MSDKTRNSDKTVKQKPSFLKKLKDLFAKPSDEADPVVTLRHDYEKKKSIPKRPTRESKKHGQKKTASATPPPRRFRSGMQSPATPPAKQKLEDQVQEAKTIELSASELLEELQHSHGDDEKHQKIVSDLQLEERATKKQPLPVSKDTIIHEDFEKGGISDTLLKLSDESVQIMSLTRQNFPVLEPFMENILQWIEQNLGHGLLGKSLKQVYSADADFELEPEDFIIRFLQGIQINNLSPLIKIIYLRVYDFLDKGLADEIMESVARFERKIRIDRLVEIFPWQKKKTAMRQILITVTKEKENALFDSLEKTTREKTKELTIKKWLAVVSQSDYYEQGIYKLIERDLTALSSEFKKSTAETRLLVVNVEEMIAQAELEKAIQALNDQIIEKMNDLQDRKTRLIENLYNLLENLTAERLSELKTTIDDRNEIDVFTLLQLLLDSDKEPDKDNAPILDMSRWREELRTKEALKRMYFISRAFKHDLLSRSLLILGCLTETDETSYIKKVKKIDTLYGFNLQQQLKDHPFNPNSTKAIVPNGRKYTLQFEKKTISGTQKEEMILYREGSILAQLVIPVLKQRSKGDKEDISIEGTQSHLHRCAFGLETMINFYHSHDEITLSIKSKDPAIWDDQGIESLKTMIANKQSHFLVLTPDIFGLNAFQWQRFMVMGYIVGKLIDDIFIPLGKHLKSVVEF